MNLSDNSSELLFHSYQLCHSVNNNRALLPAEAPTRLDVSRQRTYKTKEEVEKSKTLTSTVVVTLLVIAVVVPMLQYYGYTARD